MEDAMGMTEITVLGWSVILLLVHIVIQMLWLVKDKGLLFAFSNREDSEPVSAVCDRLTRGLRNYVETYGAFIALALALAVTGKAGGMGATGAMVWFWARVVYIPVFAAGIPYLRTAVWTVSVIGLIMMLVQLMG